MKTPKLNRVDVACLVISLGATSAYWIDAYRDAKTGELWFGLAGVLAVAGLLVATDVFLARRKSTAWMERFHWGFFIVLMLAVLGYAGVALQRGLSAP